MMPAERQELEAIIARIRGTGSPLRGWRILSLRTTARWIREALAGAVVEAELEMDLRDLADQLEELAGVEARPPVEDPGRLDRKKMRRTPPPEVA